MGVMNDKMGTLDFLFSMVILALNPFTLEGRWKAREGDLLFCPVHQEEALAAHSHLMVVSPTRRESEPESKRG